MLKIKKKSQKNPALNREDIKYVIYCRKSREEGSDGQKQSLLDQLKVCLDYARQKNISIENHNEFTDRYFRDESYHRRLRGCKGVYEQSVLEQAEGLFYIVEQKSAKIPNNRPQRTQLIELVKKGKIKGILSFAPDRHARNLVESGELVELIDKQYLDVQYTNFTFENNENGRMILGINFVISYNYSDVLSRNVNRGNKGTIERGQARGMYKYGYVINNEKYHEPDEKYFEVRKEAFRRKVYENQTDEMIWNYLVSSGFRRKFKTADRESLPNKKGLYKIRLDPFYYGILISGNNETDLRDGANPYYQSLITEEEHQILLDRYIRANPASLRTYKTSEEYDEIKPFPNKFILYDGQGLSFELPNPKRFRTALAKLKVNKPDASLKNIVKPNQIKYKLNGVKIEGKQLSIDGDVLIGLVSKYLKTCFKIDEEGYRHYREHQLEEYDINMKSINEERRKLQIQYNHISSLMENYARNFNKQNNPDEIQKKVYGQDIQNYQQQLDYLEQELTRLTTNHRNAILELDAFVQGLNKIGETYDTASYVRKRKMVTLLFSNIIITSEKKIEFKANPGLEGLFTLNGKAGQDRTADNGSEDRCVTTTPTPQSILFITMIGIIDRIERNSFAFLSRCVTTIYPEGGRHTNASKFDL